MEKVPKEIISDIIEFATGFRYMQNMDIYDIYVLEKKRFMLNDLQSFTKIRKIILDDDYSFSMNPFKKHSKKINSIFYQFIKNATFSLLHENKKHIFQKHLYWKDDNTFCRKERHIIRIFDSIYFVMFNNDFECSILKKIL